MHFFSRMMLFWGVWGCCDVVLATLVVDVCLFVLCLCCGCGFCLLLLSFVVFCCFLLFFVVFLVLGLAVVSFGVWFWGLGATGWVRGLAGWVCMLGGLCWGMGAVKKPFCGEARRRAARPGWSNH